MTGLSHPCTKVSLAISDVCTVVIFVKPQNSISFFVELVFVSVVAASAPTVVDTEQLSATVATTASGYSNVQQRRGSANVLFTIGALLTVLCLYGCKKHIQNITK